jgi:outer membrane receptor protein involved in Fe transport
MQRHVVMRTFAAALAATTAIVGFAETAAAQIEEIVVTTRKREENLQDVPIVVTAFSAATIERKGINDLADIAKYTSGLNLDEGFNKQDTRIVLRGLSPTRGRQNVAILQDEVDISSLAQTTAGGSFLINPRLLDIERIEVIKGPHAALYGRSAFNGAINYITRKPGDEFYGNAQVDLGTHGKYEGRASISGPVLEDKLSLGFNAAGWHFGGFYDSPTTGKGLGGGEGYGIAGAFTATPNDTLTFIGRIEYSNDDFGPEAATIKLPTLVPVPAVALASNATGPCVIGVGSAAATIAAQAAVCANPANASYPQTVGSMGSAKTFGVPSPSRNPRTGKDYPGSSREILRTSLRITAEFDPVTFTSITGYGDNKQFQFNDALSMGDFASPAISGAQETYFDADVVQWSQELRLQSNGDGPLTWTVGAMTWNEHLSQLVKALRCVSQSGGTAGGDCYTIFAAAGDVLRVNSANPALPAPDVTDRRTFHYSGYGMFDYAVTDQLKATVELRYTAEQEKTAGYGVTGPTFVGCQTVTTAGRNTSATGVITCANPGAQVTGVAPTFSTATNFFANTPAQTKVRTFFWTPRFTVDYKATDDALLFASVALGKKPGGFSPLAALSTPAAIINNTYEPEKMWVYELGAKTTWMDGRVQLNGAAYYQDYSAKQVSITFVDPNSVPTPNQLSTRVVNAAAAEVKGFEIDASLAPTDAFSANISYTYNDGQYKDFTDINAGVSAISRAAVNNPTSCTVIVVNGQNRCSISYAGNRLEGAPKHSLTMGGEVRGEVSADLGWFIDSDIRFQSSRFTSFENSLSMDSYWLVDLRAGLKNDAWSVTTYVNNVFNDDTMKASAVYIQPWSIAYLNVTGRTPLSIQAPSGARAIFPDKRLFGVRASVNF